MGAWLGVWDGVDDGTGVTLTAGTELEVWTTAC